MEIKLIKKYPIMKHILLMIGILITIILITLFLLRIYTRHGKEYILPDILGKSIEEVKSMNEMKRFEVVLIDSLYVNNKKGGIVLAMNPNPVSKVKSGRKIYVTITAHQPEDVEMPDLVDLTIRQAVSLLESYGLACGKLTFTQDIAKNAVLKQMVGGDIIFPKKKIARHSTIDLLIGSGIDSLTRSGTSVPLVIGKTPREAKRALHIGLLNVGKEYYAKGVTEENARVSKQEPDYTNHPSARLGATVDLWYVADGQMDFDKTIQKYTSSQADSSGTDEQFDEEQGW